MNLRKSLGLLLLLLFCASALADTLTIGGAGFQLDYPAGWKVDHEDNSSMWVIGNQEDTAGLLVLKFDGSKPMADVQSIFHQQMEKQAAGREQVWETTENVTVHGMAGLRQKGHGYIGENNSEFVLQIVKNSKGELLMVFGSYLIEKREAAQAAIASSLESVRQP